ncbi:MAG TPA: protein kinase [Thermoanaerobaculia bacterium]|nr:protein kinase [Thermoanaerobaculia bacterium]
MPEATDLTARYQLEQLLNWTGSARTFRGLHPDTGATVAVKLLSLSRTPAAPALARRFETTVGVLRTLRHPALPRILDHGLTSSHDAYLVTAWADGDPLPDAGPVSPAFLMPVLLQVVEALETLSLHGLVHLNLRPDNILATIDGRVSLVGWGTSLLTVDWQSHSRPAGAGGSEDYAAPEVRRPHAAGDALWRADLFSLAAVATRLLGGLQAAPAEEAPSVQLPRRASESLHDPEQLRLVLERCLSPDPAARPDSYVELSRALQHAMPRVTASVAETQPIAALRLAGGGARRWGAVSARATAAEPARADSVAVIIPVSHIAGPHLPKGSPVMSKKDDADDPKSAGGKQQSSRRGEGGEGESTWGGFDPDKTMLGIDPEKTMLGIDPSRLMEAEAAKASPPPPEPPVDAPPKEPSTNPIDPKQLREEDQEAESEEGGAPTLLGVDMRSLGFDPDKTMLGIDPGGALAGAESAVAPATPSPPSASPPAMDATTAVPLAAVPAATEPGAPAASTTPKVAAVDETVFLPRPQRLANTPSEAPPADAPAPTDRTVMMPAPAARDTDPATTKMGTTPAAEGTVMIPIPGAVPSPESPAVDRTVMIPVPAAKVGAPPAEAPKEAASRPSPAPGTVGPASAAAAPAPPSEPKRSAKPAPPPVVAPPPSSGGKSAPTKPPAAKSAPPVSAPTPAAPASPSPAAPPAAAAAGASPAAAGKASAGRSMTWLWIAIPAVGLLVILAIVVVVAIKVLPGMLGGGEAETPAVAEAPPVVVEQILELPEETPLEMPPELQEASDLLAAGQPLQARQRLDAISELVESTEQPVAPEVYEAYRVLREEVLAARRDQLVDAMRAAWSNRNLAALRQVLRGIAPEEEQALQASLEAKPLLDRTRAVNRSLARGESTLQGGDPIAALVLGRAFESEYGELAGVWDLRERAAAQVERSVDELIGTGQPEEAESRLTRLRELWPDRAGLGGRQQRIQGQRQSQERWDTLYASIEQTGESGRLHEALAMFEGVDVPERHRVRFASLRTRTQEAFAAADRNPPSVTLASAADVEYRRNEPILIELLVRDDYAVVSVALHARRARGQYQTIELERVAADRYRGEIPVSIHANERSVEIWAEATDHSGNITRIGSSEQPIEIRRGRGVRG